MNQDNYLVEYISNYFVEYINSYLVEYVNNYFLGYINNYFVEYINNSVNQKNYFVEHVELFRWILQYLINHKRAPSFFYILQNVKEAA